MARPRRDEQLQAWCDQQWQTHERHGRVGLPFHRDRHPCLAAPGCPEILAALIAFCEVVAPAATGGLMERLERLTGEKPPLRPAEWRETYAEDLEPFPKLEMHLVNEEIFRAVSLAFRLAGLTSSEQDVMRLALAGDGLRSIIRTLHRKPALVAAQLAEGTEKLKLLPRARPRTHDAPALANSGNSH